MDFYQALQCRAMLAVTKPDRAAWLRHVLREYSKAFYTPLYVVEELPLERVLLTYYEHSFEQMDEDEREDYIERLCETEEERKQREQRDAASEQAGEDFFATLNQQVEEDVKRGKPLPRVGKRPKPKLPGKLTAFDSRSATAEGPPPKPTPPAARAAALEEAPDIDMRFGDGGNLLGEDLLSSDPLGATRKRKA
jgi:hypothetical protein